MKAVGRHHFAHALYVIGRTIARILELVLNRTYASVPPAIRAMTVQCAKAGHALSASLDAFMELVIPIPG